MPDKPTNAEDKANADEIKDQDATEQTPRGNVRSHDDGPGDLDAPPPMPG